MKKINYLIGTSLVALGLSASANDFQGNLIGIRGGGSFPFAQSTVKGGGVVSDASLATRGPLGFAGVNYTYNMADVMGMMDLGVSLGADWFFGSSGFKVDLGNDSGNFYQTQQTRYEVALRTGKMQGNFYPFIKVGAVAGDWKTAAQTTLGSVNKTDLRWGATVGLGVDYKIHCGGSLGFITEADWYASKSYGLILNNGGAPYASIDSKPWALNLAVTYKYKIA